MSVDPVVDQHTGTSFRARVVFQAARLALRPLMTCWPLTPWGMRPLSLIDRAAQLLPTPRGTRYERIEFAGFSAEWVRASTVVDEAISGAVLYFHGGAFVTCGLGTHRRAVALISVASGLPVLSVGYRHLPAVPLAGSIDDCCTAYQWLLDQGFDPQRLVLAGDSAGGHLAFATAQRVRQHGQPRPAGLVALSPWLDLDASSKLAHPNALRDAYAPAKRLPQLVQLCLGGTGELDPLLSPVNQDLSGLPPVLITAAEGEMLRCDAELMAQRLANADVPCTLHIWEGQVHAFPVLGDLLPESRAAIDEVGAFIRRVTATGALDTTKPSVLAG